MEQKKLITIVVPVYNCEECLPRCLDIIVAQTYPILEILLIDDGSLDGSGAICDRYAAQDARVKVIHIENAGVSNARNLGIKSATGDYIAFVDADDYIDPAMYEKMLKKALADDSDLVFCSYSQFNEECVIPDVEPQVKVFTEKRELDRLVCGSRKERIMGSVWRTLCKRAYISNFCFDTSVILGEDQLLVLEMMMGTTRGSCVPEPLYHYYHQNKTNHLKYINNKKYYSSQQRLTEKMVALFEACGRQDLAKYRKWETYTSTVKMLMRCEDWKARVSILQNNAFWPGLNTAENFRAHREKNHWAKTITKFGNILVRQNYLGLYKFLLKLRWKNGG